MVVEEAKSVEVREIAGETRIVLHWCMGVQYHTLARTGMHVNYCYFRVRNVSPKSFV